MRKMEKKDLTQGSIYKKLILFFLPLAAGNVFQQIYYAVDALIVGRYAGTIALAAVGGTAGSFSYAAVNFFIAMCGGGSVLISQFFGARNHESLKNGVHSSMWFSVILGVVVSAGLYMMTRCILLWTKVPSDSFEMAFEYLRIIFLGMVFIIVYNMAAGILRAVGDSRTPFIIVAVSCVINIVSDYVFVAVLGRGVVGAAVATVLSQLVCAVVCVIRLMRIKDDDCVLRLSELKPDFDYLKRSLMIGVPLALQSLMYSVTNIRSQVCINILGTKTVAAWGLTGRIDGFFWGLMAAANICVTTFIGQNYGKRDFARMKAGVKASFVIFEIVAVSFSVTLMLTARSILPWFDKDPEVIESTMLVFKALVPFYFIWVVNEVFSGALRGEGKTFGPFLVLMFSVCIYRLIWMSTVFAARPNLLWLCLCYPTSWVIAGSGMFVLYMINIRKRRNSA
ncbi:MAG: MATE family efflux transporter [Firmicutes bacterium]|nr:MATE family efflux transporter [Bacillota bacterium]